MIAIIDYDAGNLKSVYKALISLGQDVVITREHDVILNADKAILPGVGNFDDAMDKLNEFDLVDTIHKFVATGKPLLGICLGLQLFFEESEESVGTKGLGLLKGKIVRIPEGDGLKIPHMGWNSLEIKPGTKLFEGVNNGSYVYFVHSYYLKAENSEVVAATTEYGVNIHASVEYENLYACQFHPEKSSDVGLKILENFAKL